MAVDAVAARELDPQGRVVQRLVAVQHQAEGQGLVLEEGPSGAGRRRRGFAGRGRRGPARRWPRCLGTAEGDRREGEAVQIVKAGNLRGVADVLDAAAVEVDRPRHSRRARSVLWVTKSTVAPERQISPIRARHFMVKTASPAARASSTMKTSGSTLIAVEKVEPGLHAAGIGAQRLVDDLAEFAEVDDAVELAVDLLAAHSQAHAAHVDVFPPRILGMEAGAQFEDRRDLAADATLPEVLSSVPARIFNSVLLPAPLRPTTPTTSPRRTSKEMSCSAQNSLCRGRRG